MPPPPYPPQRPQESNPFAVVSLICGILSFCGLLPAVLAVVFGHLGRSRIRQSGGRLAGAGMCTAGLIMGYMVISLFVVFIGLFFGGAFVSLPVLEKTQREAQIESTSPFDVASVPVPEFPDPPAPKAIGNSKVKAFQIALRPSAKKDPGSAMKLRVYLPPGDLRPRSLPCVFVAPAGTTLLTGADIDELNDESCHEECLPYAEAGMIVVFYSLDGPAPVEDRTNAGLAKAFPQFVAAQAGLVNARNAVEFALAKLPAVDPAKLFCAGHSSAGTLSLLFGEHEPRLAGCVAYAPVSDVEGSFAKVFKEPSDSPNTTKPEVNSALNLIFPRFTVFTKRSSPLTHADRMAAPVFLFHAKDDERVAWTSSQSFATKLKASDRNCTFFTTDEGGHYESMIAEGIPRGIQWIREQDSHSKGQDSSSTPEKNQ